MRQPPTVPAVRIVGLQQDLTGADLERSSGGEVTVAGRAVAGPPSGRAGGASA